MNNRSILDLDVRAAPAASSMAAAAGSRAPRPPPGTGYAGRIVALSFVVFLLGACTDGGNAAVTPKSATAADAVRTARSVDMLDRLLTTDSPGCSAAVGVEGKVVWAGSRGVADLATGEKLTGDTVFDIGSVSKQFTATAILLLAADGKLSIDDTVAEHLTGLPAWAGRVSIAELMHHTSGIPDYGRLLQERGHTEPQRVTQAQILQTLADAPALRFQPGQQFEYTNSNYVLLAEIVHSVSGVPLPQVLRERIFQPLGLDMVLDPDGKIPGKAVSYVDMGYSSGPQAIDEHWETLGAGGIQTTPSELVRWGDNYRTGKVGGSHLLQAQLANPVEANSVPDVHGLGTHFTYAAGIMLADDATLTHLGAREGFDTAFEVSPDRRTAVAVTCNTAGSTAIVLAAELRKIWT